MFVRSKLFLPGTLAERGISMDNLTDDLRRSIAGIGESSRGLAQAAADVTGRPAGLKIAPDALRLSSEELAREVLGAVQAAFDAAMEAAAAQVAAPGHIAETVQRIQSDIDARTRHVTEELAEIRFRMGKLIG